MSGRSKDDWDGVDWARVLLADEHYEDCEAPDGYVKNWQDISCEYRESVSWSCEKCGLNLRKDPGLLHVHHIDQDKKNNERWNLLALCVVCHADEHPFMQPDEKTIKILQKNRQDELNDFILRVRRDQGRCEECGGHFVDGICSQCGSEFSLWF